MLLTGYTSASAPLAGLRLQCGMANVPLVSNPPDSQTSSPYLSLPTRSHLARPPPQVRVPSVAPTLLEGPAYGPALSLWSTAGRGSTTPYGEGRTSRCAGGAQRREREGGHGGEQPRSTDLAHPRGQAARRWGSPRGISPPPLASTTPPRGKDWIRATSPLLEQLCSPPPPEEAFHCKAEQLQGLPYGGDAVEVYFSLLKVAV